MDQVRCVIICACIELDSQVFYIDLYGAWLDRGVLIKVVCYVFKSYLDDVPLYWEEHDFDNVV